MADYKNVTFTKPVVINAPGKTVVFDGCDFTEAGMITIAACDSITFTCCRFYGFTGTAAKLYPIDVTHQEPMLFVVENCYFGDNAKNSYNLMEIRAKLKTGSKVNNNYFTKDCCTHNIVNVYNVDEAGTVENPVVISMSNNKFMMSRNAMRLGPKGSPCCTVLIQGNTWYESTNDGWGGLLLIQPFDKQTVTMNNVMVEFIDNINNSTDPQLYYLYSAGVNIRFNVETNLPTIFVDGELIEPADLVNAGEPIEGLEETEEEIFETSPEGSPDIDMNTDIDAN